MEFLKEQKAGTTTCFSCFHTNRKEKEREMESLSSSQSVLSGPAISATAENLLELQKLTPNL
jgi:hypothetical protein